MQVDTKRIFRLYNAAFAVMAALCLLSFFVLDVISGGHEDNATILNMSGRQRMLSQRTVLLASQFVMSQDSEQKKKISDDLSTMIVLMEHSHEELVSSFGNLDRMPANLRDLYFGKEFSLDQNVRDFLRNLSSLIAGEYDGQSTRFRDLLQQSQTLLLALDKAVNLYEDDFNSRFFALRTLQKSILFMILISLVVQHFFIFRPVNRSLIVHSQEMEKAKNKAEQIALIPINNPSPVIHIDVDGHIVFANPAALRKFPDIEEKGFEDDALLGLKIFAHDLPEGKKKVISREVTCGDTVYQQTVTSVVADGRPTLVIHSYDITAIKEAESKARLLEAAIVNAKDGVIITTADLEHPEIVYVNEAISRISGYEAEELIGKTPRILQGHDTNPQTLEELKNSLKRGKPFKGELMNYTKDGIAYWLEISIVPVRDHHGTVTHFAAIERDTTQRKAYEKAIQVNREAAEVASRVKGDFLANMSHELRTPMNGIIGLSELLMEMEVGAEPAELATAINSSSRNLLILLNDILDLSKIEAGELTLEHIPFDTRRTVRQTMDLLTPLASRKGVVLESTINPIVPERLMGDPSRLQQILNNLVSNAIKFTEVGFVRVDVSSARDHIGDPELVIRVEDSGIGIPEDKRHNVFNKFTQGDVSTARKYGGTGLGLAITKELVDMMGGTISFDSALGKGTTFYVSLPIELAKTSVSDEKVKASSVPINKEARLLVVDDHPVNLLFMRKVLKKIGFAHVDEATSGKEAIDMAEDRTYDLIFMDCQMPEIDGFEASTIIREREESIGDIKIIAVTADAMKGAREKCLDAGMNDYISKPVDIEKLKNVLGRWLPLENTKQETLEEHAPAKNNSPTPVDTSDLMVMDWERLEMFTDGNSNEEKALIGLFTTYAVESLDTMRSECKDGPNAEWKKAAHKIKGSAANLGAQVLSSVCYEAELAFDAPAVEKSAILHRVQDAYDEICETLRERESA
ncbi:MAG: response regulator [Alphaproteobacteria bacterium]|nr:response regulator [Alphaproteobacteria bacterium]